MLKPPTSLIASLQPSKRSGWFSTSQWAPKTPPASSSATNASTTSRGGCLPWRTQSATTASVIASMSFMSTAPRPHRQSSRISPANGSTCQSAASAGTTSRCPWISSAGRLGSVPDQRATTEARPGADSKTCGFSPASVRRSATHSAAARSLLVGLDESMRMRSRQSSTTSSSTRVVRPQSSTSYDLPGEAAEQRAELAEVDRRRSCRFRDVVTGLLEGQDERQRRTVRQLVVVVELREVQRQLRQRAVVEPRVDGDGAALRRAGVHAAGDGCATRHRLLDGLLQVDRQV